MNIKIKKPRTLVPALIMIIAFALQAACRGETRPPDFFDPQDISVSGDSDSAGADADHVDGDIAALPIEAVSGVPITWGFFDANGPGVILYPDNGKIAKELSERFDVILRTERNVSDFEKFQRKLMAEKKLPDIFHTNILSADELIESGGVRKIPWDMVARYAPNYFALLESNERLFEYFRTNDSAQYMLPGLERTIDILSVWSIYRLDWLEKIGVWPNGSVTQISDRVSFTDAAFDYAEFVNIMQSFAAYPPFRGFTTRNYGNDWYNLTTLFGMWGLNRDNVFENGSAVLTFASDGFRSALEFISLMNRTETIYFGTDWSMSYWGGATGWWNFNVFDMLREDGYIASYFYSNPDAKLLIAPPERGPENKQGAHGYYRPNELNVTRVFYVSSEVSDEKLAKILEIFEALSCDPETYVIANHGFEGVDYEWEDVPYDSGILRLPTSTEIVGIFTTATLDERAGRRRYQIPSQAFYDFATSGFARSLMLTPYKSDPGGDYAEAYYKVENRYPASGLAGRASEYYRAVISGEKDLIDTWDEYIKELKAYGLDEWTEYLNALP
ncbi:MAG: hypothetical protein FWF03_00600 [Defluviitaleaceae bacterium]|nr:hypothetical protein [Defluviitaleaceae bacterium]